MVSTVGAKTAEVEHADWRQSLEALAAWIYRLYPETSVGVANPWPGKAPMRTWWTGMSPGERRQALTIDDPGVIAMAVSLCRLGSSAHFEIDAYRRRPPPGAMCGDRMTLYSSQQRFRCVRAYADEPVIEGTASKFIVSQSLLRIDISQFMAKDVANIFSAVEDQSCNLFGKWQVPRYDALGPKKLEILGAKDASSSAFEIVDAIAGGRAFSIPCKSESAEDPWCRISWFRAEQERGVTAGHFLANLAEALMWRKFWRDHNMSRRQRPRQGPRHALQAQGGHSEDSDAKLDSWWMGLDGCKRRSAMRKALTRHSFRLVAEAGRNLSLQFTQKSAICALSVLGIFVEAAVDLSRDLMTCCSSPSILCKTPIDDSEPAAWFRAALRFGVEEVRCQENSDALIKFEERSDGSHTLTKIAVPRTGRVKARKRRTKKILKAAALASPPPRVSADPVARTTNSSSAVLCETRCDLDRAAATIARRWRRYSSNDGLTRRCRSECSGDVDSRHRRSSTGPYALLNVDATSDQRSCPPSPSRHHFEKNREGLEVRARDRSQSTGSDYAHGTQQTSDYDSTVTGTFGQCGSCTPSSQYIEQQHNANDSRDDSGPVAVVSCSTSSRGEKTSSTSSEKRLVHAVSRLQPVAAPGVSNHRQTTSNLRMKKKERSPGTFDLSKTAELATSYSEALRKNIDTEVKDIVARHPKTVHQADQFANIPLFKQYPFSSQAQSHALLQRTEQQCDAQPIYSDAVGKREEGTPMSGLQIGHPGEEYELVIWRLARANLTLRRENLKLQAEVCRLYTELSAHRGGKSTSLSSYILPSGNETSQQPYPRGIPLKCGDKAASVSSERIARPRRIPAATTVDDDWPVFRDSVRHTFSASHNQPVRRGSSSDAAGRRIHEPEQAQRVLAVNTSRYSPPQPSLHNGLGPPTVGYYYYICEKQAGFFDVASDDGRLTICSDTSPAYPHHQSGPKPLQAVRECAVLLPSSQQHAACMPQQRSPNVPGRPQFFLDSGSRGSSSALCDNNHARIMTDSIDDIAESSDEFSQSSSEENHANEEDDDKWATTTTRGSGKPPSLARANLSLDDELPDDLLSASSHSSLAFSNRGEHGHNGEGANQGNEACSSQSLRRIWESRNREAGVSPAGISLQNENSAGENGRALIQREPASPNHGGHVNEVDRHVPPHNAARVPGMSTVVTAASTIDSLRQHRKARACKRVLVDESLFSASSRLADDIRAFAEKVSRRQRSRESAWRAARELVRNVVKSLWPRARVEPYGSCVTRLSLADMSSDLDLVIRLPRVRVATPAMTPGDLEGRNAIKETWPQELARRLRSEDWVDTSSVRTIASAFVPIVKLVTVALGETCEVVRLDVSFETPWHRGLDANRLIVRMLDDMPAVRPLLLVLKKHAAERGLNASYTGGLSSYALTLLVVRYVQEQPRKDLDPAALLLGFFDFYAHRFDAGKTGISVGRGCFFSRAELGSRHYAAAAGYAIGDNHDVASRANCLARSFHFDPLYVEDPLGPGNNVGRNCFRIAQIQRTWSDALCALTDAIAKNSRPTYRGTGPEIRRPNLLCSIISLPDEYDASLNSPNSSRNAIAL